MSKTKKIYFLAAIVMLIGCYALNLSYSIFVQTEEKNVVDSYVPEISYVISQNEFAIEKNSTKIIKITINNTSKVPFNYGLKATTTATNYKIQTIKDNLSYGLLNTQDSKDIFLAITNNEDKCIKINFDLIYNYITVNFDKEAYLRDSNIDNTNQYEYDKPISLKEMIINNATNNESETKSFLIEENKITDNLENESYLVKNTIDLGTYYYFKGNVLDNYLSFNNMCFRVVSIDNMNNIKLIFAGDGSCDTTSNSTGYAKLEKDYISVKFSEENDFSYSESNLKTALDIWYKNKFSDDLEVNDYEWCSGSNSLNVNIFGNCDGKKVLSKVGALTKDEISMSFLNSVSYLKDNSITDKWWSISISQDNKVYTMKDTLEKTSFLEELKVRPVIVLHNIYVKGEGTKNNPYIIDDNMIYKNVCE